MGLKIEILLTREGGDRIPLMVTEGHGGVWSLQCNGDALKSLSVEEAWAVSKTCAEMLLRRLPVDPSDVRLVRAVGALHGDRIGPWEEDP